MQCIPPQEGDKQQIFINFPVSVFKGYFGLVFFSVDVLLKLLNLENIPWLDTEHGLPNTSPGC